MSTLQESVFWSAVAVLFVLAAWLLASEALTEANRQINRSLTVLDNDPGDDHPEDDWAAS